METAGPRDALATMETLRTMAINLVLLLNSMSISFGASTSQTPPISLTVEYSGKDLARTCIRANILAKELSIALNTYTASCTNILVDGVLEDSVGMPPDANS